MKRKVGRPRGYPSAVYELAESSLFSMNVARKLGIREGMSELAYRVMVNAAKRFAATAKKKAA